MVFNGWNKHKRQVKRFRVREDFQHLTAVESRRRGWAIWWAMATGLAALVWWLLGLAGPVEDLAYTIFAIVFGLPLAVACWMLLLNHLVRVDRRDRTVVHMRRFGLLPYRIRRFEWAQGHLRSGHMSVKKKIQSDGDAALGCLLLFLGPLGALIQIVSALAPGKKDQYETHRIPTLEWFDAPIAQDVVLCPVETDEELDQLLATISDKFPDITA